MHTFEKLKEVFLSEMDSQWKSSHIDKKIAYDHRFFDPISDQQQREINKIKQQPKRVEKARIMVDNTAMDTDKIKIFGPKVRVDGLDKVAAIEEAERAKMRDKVQRIVDHGITVFVNRQLIYNFAEEIFADKVGVIMARDLIQL